LNERPDSPRSERAPADELGDPESVAGPVVDDSEEVAPDEPAAPAGELDVDEAASAMEADLEALVVQRDEYLSLARRVQADFENFRKRTMRQGADERERGAANLIEKLLPVLDACDGALTHGHDDVKPVYDLLMDVLEKEGLELLFPVGEPFDPNLHDAVMHEPAEEGETATITEVLRSGYTWRGRVLRPAMVKVKG
jgi:molecular chaperone GrpE